MFRTACSLGKLEIAKWIYSLGDVDIHAGMDYAFISSCMDNYVEIAKWLYTLGDIDIYYDNNVLFKFICQSGNLYVFQWFFGDSGPWGLNGLIPLGISVQTMLMFLENCPKGGLGVS